MFKLHVDLFNRSPLGRDLMDEIDGLYAQIEQVKRRAAERIDYDPSVGFVDCDDSGFFINTDI